VACQRCGARQGDPQRGPSPWARAVSQGEQILVCPVCQQDADWRAGLQRCPTCDGIRLSKTLGVLRCSACGWSGEAVETPEKRASTDEQLADEVRAALARVLRPPGDATDQ
jgi:C4-type Zn-finger protein